MVLCKLFGFILLYFLHIIIFRTGIGIKVSQKAIDQDMYETEKRLVDEITTLQGIRPQPSKRDVDTLIKRFSQLQQIFVIFSVFM